MEQVQTEKKPFKLNMKRTMLIGFAFFGILLLWQVYDSWCPTFLSELFAKTFDPNYSALRQITLDNHSAQEVNDAIKEGMQSNIFANCFGQYMNVNTEAAGLGYVMPGDWSNVPEVANLQNTLQIAMMAILRQRTGKTILIGRKALKTLWENWQDYVVSKIIT